MNNQKPNTPSALDIFTALAKGGAKPVSSAEISSQKTVAKVPGKPPMVQQKTSTKIDGKEVSRNETSWPDYTVSGANRMTAVPDKTLIGTDKSKKPETPHQLVIPTYLMNFPFTMDNREANNAWMKGAEEEPINYDVAFSQWLQLYNFLAANALVYILPSAGNFQDLEYVANLGIVLSHIKQPTAILSKFMSKPRMGEENVGKPFFDLMKYKTVMCPFGWEGEAELKHLHDNVYLGGYGQRSTTQAFDWMEKTFNMKIIQIKETDEHLYHVDCMVFPITREKTLVCTELLKPSEVKAIESETEIIDVSSKDAHNGITNCVRARNMILCASELPKMKETDKGYRDVRATVEKLTDICLDNAMEPVLFNLSEGEKSGAALSCLVMHLNRSSYDEPLI